MTMKHIVIDINEESKKIQEFFEQFPIFSHWFDRAGHKYTSAVAAGLHCDTLNVRQVEVDIVLGQVDVLLFNNDDQVSTFDVESAQDMLNAELLDY